MHMGAPWFVAHMKAVPALRTFENIPASPVLGFLHVCSFHMSKVAAARRHCCACLCFNLQVQLLPAARAPDQQLLLFTPPGALMESY